MEAQSELVLQIDTVAAVVDASGSSQAHGSGVDSSYPHQPLTAQLTIPPQSDPVAHVQALDRYRARPEAASWEPGMVVVVDELLVHH